MAKAQPCCKECGTTLGPAKPNAPHQRFCSGPCRKKFNNRCATRGAELYRYFMSMRYNRATHSGALAIMTLMAQAWHDEDVRERDGRPSWIKPDLSGDPLALQNT